MFNTILVPLDGSALAEQALPTAARLARESNSALHLVHVHAPGPEPIHVEGLPVLDDELHSMAELHEKTYLERLAAKHGGGSLNPLPVRLDGPVVPTLNRYAREVGAGLVVMTTHGRTGFLQRWLGSVAESIVEGSGTTLLMLRPGGHGAVEERPFKRILVPLDGSPLAEEILECAADVAHADGGELALLRVVPSGSPERDEAERYLGQVRLPREVQTQQHVVADDDTAQAVVRTAKEMGDALVALTTHGKSGPPRTSLGTVADRIVKLGASALLIVRPQGARSSD